MRRINTWVGVLLTIFLMVANTSTYAGGTKPTPPLDNILHSARSTFSSGNSSVSIQEMEYSIKKYYYQIQYQNQKLEILKEVKGHFEKSISKATEKYDEGEEGISQSDITKLKLGLAGTLNDIYEIETNIHIARLSLTDILGDEFSPDAELSEPEIIPVEFEVVDYEAWIKQGGSDSKEKDVNLRQSYLKVVEAMKKMDLAQKNRKITRALLVSEVANYDFGIGDAGDLFEALVIYTRVLNGYYDSVYNFNLSVANLERFKVI